MKINQLILGSTSPFRAQLLRQAGIINFRQLGSQNSEMQVRKLAPRKLAEARAEYKGQGVPAPEDSLIIAADQTLECEEGVSYGKVLTAAAAVERLRLFSGKTHYLHSAFSLIYCKNGELKRTLITRTETATMQMRPLTLMQIKAYIETEEWRGCAGCYQFENRGVHLFAKVVGESSTIIGLPLTALFQEMRSWGLDFLVKPKGPWKLSNRV